VREILKASECAILFDQIVPGQPHIVDLPSASSPADLDILLNRISAGDFRRSTEVVFVSDQTFFPVIDSERGRPGREAAIERVNDKPLLILAYDSAQSLHRLKRITRDGLSDVAQSATAVSRIREIDLARMVDQTRDFCYYRATKTYHFITPSEKHCSRFLRVGNMIRSVEILDRLAFWILPEIAASDLLLIDTWSIAAVALRALQKLRIDRPFDCLTTHPRRDKKSGLELLQRLLSMAPPDPTLSCLISINSSGSFLADLQDILRPIKDRFRLVRPICLYSFEGTPGTSETLCRLQDTVENYPSAEECALCKDTRPIAIDPSLYHVKSADEREVVLGEEHFTEGRVFLEKYQHVRAALRLHRSDPNDNRHHAFDIDVLTLLSDTKFSAAYLKTLDELPDKSPEVIITPNHAAGRKMGAIARERLGGVLIVHNDLRQSLPAQEVALIKDATRVLVVDDVLNSGTRMEEYNRAFRERFGHLKSISFIVGIARPSSESEWKTAERAVTDKHAWTAVLRFVERICLPRWDEKLCPWCAEYDFLTSVSETLPTFLVPDWLNQRILRLAERLNGIADDPILLLPGVAVRDLASQSLSGPEGFGPTLVTFSLAAALQALRHDKRANRRLDPRFPDCRVFGIKNLQFYSESLLRALMLRLVAPNEWGSETRTELQQEILHDSRTVTDDVLLGEIILALDRKIIPPLGLATFEGLYSGRLGSELVHFQRALNIS
jgi:adenine/guanine phosphoribosyltransferase-like PRPP-binding protein